MLQKITHPIYTTRIVIEDNFSNNFKSYNAISFDVRTHPWKRNSYLLKWRIMRPEAIKHPSVGLNPIQRDLTFKSRQEARIFLAELL